nr:unnamed protein product [Callosobruchus analis]
MDIWFTADHQTVAAGCSTGFVCGDCGRSYKLKSSLRNHRKFECQKPRQFKCDFCSYKAKQKMHLVRHINRHHYNSDMLFVDSNTNRTDEKHVDNVLGQPSRASFNEEVKNGDHHETTRKFKIQAKILLYAMWKIVHYKEQPEKASTCGVR